ncbi:8525_t:CDS:2 [Entrophospora sp. SA101]|nr:8525_t:CDS:2 [Entrophospora sp. SA101]
MSEPNGNCLYCYKPNTGRQWCKTCDPERLVESWNIENNHIRECILNNTDVAIKEIKSGYDITLDFISMIETHLQCFYEDQSYVSRKLLKLYESFEPFDKIQIESSYTPREGVFYIRRTLGLGQFSKPENYKDHYIY